MEPPLTISLTVNSIVGIIPVTLNQLHSQIRHTSASLDLLEPPGGVWSVGLKRLGLPLGEAIASITLYRVVVEEVHYSY